MNSVKVSNYVNKSLKEKLKTITRKTTPMTFDERILKLKQTAQGWLYYFRMASIQGKLKELDGWIRNRLRYCIWSRGLGRKSPKGRGRTSSNWGLIRIMLINGVEPEMRNEFMNSIKNKQSYE